MALKSFSQPEEPAVAAGEAQVLHCCRWFGPVLAFWLHWEEVEGVELEVLWETPGRAYPLRQLLKSPLVTLLMDYYYYC